MTITTLNLAWNGFGYEGCAALARALHVNRTLVELDLTSNRIHTPALLELTKGLVLNNTLEILKVKSTMLHFNDICSGICLDTHVLDNSLYTCLKIIIIMQFLI